MAPLTVQCMPARLSLVPITTLQPASTTPVEVHKRCRRKLWIAHAAAIVPEVADTLARLLVLFHMGSERCDEAVQAALIEFLVAPLDPWPGRFAVAKDYFAHRAEVLFGMKAIENLDAIGIQFSSDVPDPSRAIAQYHAPARFGETAAD